MESSQSTVEFADPRAERTPDGQAGGPMSPCVSVCSLDERGFCRGCYRTLAEISSWLRMSAEQRWSVLGHLEQRRALLTVRGGG
jgi:hypothetical protein